MTTSMVSTSSAAQDISRPPGLVHRLRWVGITGIVVALVLSVAGWLLVLSDGNHGSVGAAFGILFMTAPVALARRRPIMAVSIVAAAAIVNGLISHDIVRCGAAFPALLYITFAVGSRSRRGGRGWAWPLSGLAIALVSVAAQRAWEPVLDNSFLALAVPLVLLVWGAGLGWAARSSRGRRIKPAVAQLS
jgi:hypothetical protein